MLKIMSRKQWNVLLILGLGLFFSVQTAMAESVSVEKQRDYYIQAKKALKKGHMRTYAQLIKKLDDYPLKPYLEYRYLRKRISSLPDSDIESFLETYDRAPVGERMRFVWLRHLAAKDRWDKFLEQYRDGGNDRTRCLKAKALFKVSRFEEAMNEADQLWLTSKSQPKICDQVFKSWKERSSLLINVISPSRIHFLGS